MTTLAVIPARLGALRLPRKPLRLLGGAPLIARVWQRIVETERALRVVVREVYAARFGEAAALRIEEALPERERESLARVLRARPAGSEPLSIVDYLYLGQIPRDVPEARVQGSRVRAQAAPPQSSADRKSVV